MKIRIAEKKDFKELINLWAYFIVDHEKRFGREGLKKNYKEIYGKILKDKLKSRKNLVLVAENNGEIIGFVSILIEKETPIYKDKKYGVFEDIFIIKSFRGKGIFNKFYRESLRWLIKNKVNIVISKINVKNKKVIKLYECKGFKNDYLTMTKIIKK